MSGLLAVGVLAGLGLLLIVGALLADARRAMRIPTAQEVRESADLHLAEQILAFDDVAGYGRAVLARAYADGVFPDRRKAPR